MAEIEESWARVMTWLAGESRSLVDIVGELGDDMIGYWWHPEWVLFGRHVAADGMAIDQRPGHGQGAVGEFMPVTAWVHQQDGVSGAPAGWAGQPLKPRRHVRSRLG